MNSRRGFLGGLIGGASALIVGRKIDTAPAETTWNVPSNILAKTADQKRTGFLASGSYNTSVCQCDHGGRRPTFSHVYRSSDIGFQYRCYECHGIVTSFGGA